MARQSIRQPAGQRRQRITFVQQVDNLESTYGSNEPTSVDLHTVWASVMPISGKEALGPNRVDASTTHFIECLYLSDVTEKMRIRFGSRMFDIISILNVEERNVKLEIQASEQK